jgi:glycerol transport system ATP-binding protein
MGLSLEMIDKVVGRETHLKGVNLELEPGSRNVILGRTLAGKTSLLRIMAGLDRPTRGHILIDGRDVTGVNVRKRNVAMVYQQFINYPSLKVYDNIASPLKLAGMDTAEIDLRVRRTAAMLHLEGLLDRLPAELSGGQQQRTAIARALVKDTELLLLDEPLVNLDYKLREEMRMELQDIFQRREAIVVYTTTEPAEVLMLGGNIIVMDEGRILQMGPTAEVYRRPVNLRVAQIFSDPPINIIKGRVHEQQVHLGGSIRWSLDGHMAHLAPGEYTFAVRSNHLLLNSSSAADLQIKATVELCEINGSETFVHVEFENTQMVVQHSGVHSVKIGREIVVHANPCHFFAYNAEGRLAAAPEQACFA